MLLQFCALGVTMSWDDGFLGARASRPHQAWHSLGHLPHLDQTGTAPWLSFGLADAVPADRVAACSLALKLSGGQRDRMRAGRPRSQGNHSPLEGESQKPSRQAKADAVGGGRRAASQKADVHPLGNSRLPASRAPAPHDGADHSRVKQVLFQIRMRAGRPRSQAMHDRADHSRVKQGCFRQVERSGSREAPYDLVALFVRTAPRSTRCLTCRSKNYPLSTIHYPLSHAPAPHDGADDSRVKQVLFQISGIGGRQCVPEGRYSSAAYAAHRWVIEVKFLLINFLH